VNLQNRVTAVLAGKVVGGSSAVNMMMTLRGSRGDYDRWGSFFGNSSDWNFDALMPYFKRALNFVPPDDAVTKSANITYDTSYWGNTSGVYAGWPSFQYPATTVQFNAWKTLPGVEYPPDSGSGQPGVYWYPTFMDPKTVTRSYARTGHYENVKQRANYHLLTGSKVNKVLLDGTTATGVSFVSAASTSGSAAGTSVRANKEVILAAGAVHSPQIMQLSGLGPRKLLTSANIETVVDLPGVGQNFQDHPMITIMFSYRNLNVVSSASLTSNATFRTWATQAWATNKSGPNAIATGNAAAWLPFRVISARYEEIAANLSAQDPASTLPSGTDPTVLAGYKAQMMSFAEALRSNHTAFYNHVLSGGTSSSILVDLHPLSRGTVNIDVTNPAGKEPIVDYRALSNPLDLPIMADLIRYTRRYYMNNTATAQYQPSETQPGARITSEQDLHRYLVQTLSPTEYHPAGTCAMMPRELGGVVDEKLRVYGVKNLRIVDASIMPTLPGANTCQTVYMIGEKVTSSLPHMFVPLLMCVTGCGSHKIRSLKETQGNNPATV
jgi:choline dehydrogenase-like flavoprotein